MQALLKAKAFFITNNYTDCISVLDNIHASHSPKILYEKQCLLFKASWLLDSDFENLKRILEDFKILKEFWKK